MYPNMRYLDYWDDKGRLEFHWSTGIVNLQFDFSTFVLFAILFRSITPKVPFYGTVCHLMLSTKLPFLLSNDLALNASLVVLINN